MECESNSDTGNNGDDWNHFIFTQTVPEQHTRKAQNKGTTKNSHIGHCTHTGASANVKVHNTFHGPNNILCSINCKYRPAATLYMLEMWFVSGI